MAKLTKYVFKDEDGVLADNVYYARENDPMLPFLKAQGYKEEKEDKKAAAKENEKVEF